MSYNSVGGGPRACRKPKCVGPIVTPVGSPGQGHLSEGQRDKKKDVKTQNVEATWTRKRSTSVSRKERKGGKSNPFQMFGSYDKHTMCQGL